MQKLLQTMRRLRAPDGCPWDQKQTHLTLRRYLLEEAAEAVDAISAGEPAEIAEELGDVLLQVAFHAVIAEEEGSFGYSDIEEAIVAKLVRRHPHVFGEAKVSGADEVVSNWQAIKAAEKTARGAAKTGSGSGGESSSPAAAVPRGLPALMRAAEVGKAAGWEMPVEPPPAPHRSSPEGGSESARAIGRHLLELAQYARGMGVDPELALREAIDAALASEESDRE
jgi:uncharacterized protein YabN with tetrapyrrole methylase and pyrophosphatase domain